MVNCSQVTWKYPSSLWHPNTEDKRYTQNRGASISNFFTFICDLCFWDAWWTLLQELKFVSNHSFKLGSAWGFVMRCICDEVLKLRCSECRYVIKRWHVWHSKSKRTYTADSDVGERVKWTHQAVYMHINLLRLSCSDSTSEQLAIAAGSSYVFAEVPILAVDCNANVRHKQDWCLAYGQYVVFCRPALCWGSLVSGHDESATTIALVWDWTFSLWSLWSPHNSVIRCAFTKVSPGTRLLETVAGRKAVRHFGVTICVVVSKQPLYSDDCIAASLLRGIRETLIIVKSIRSTATPRKSAPFAELCSRLSFDQMTWTGLFAEAFEAAVTTRSFTVSHHVWFAKVRNPICWQEKSGLLTWCHIRIWGRTW